MKLTDLEPEFMRYEERVETYEVCTIEGPHGEHGPHCLAQKTGPRAFYVPVSTLSEAQGVGFLCPKCFKENGGPVGTHQVICWSRSRGVPDHAHPHPGRWKIEGTDFADLTLNADPPSGARSVQLNGGCSWHGFVTNGEATDA